MNYSKLFSSVRNASKMLQSADDQSVNGMLSLLACEITDSADYIISENQKDIERMSSCDPRYDRLLLNKDRLKSIAGDIGNIASAKCPVGVVLRQETRPNGMKISKVAVPFGVIGVVFESRPNVVTDVFALCIKSHNCCILKGGSDAAYSNEAIVKVIKTVLRKSGLSDKIIELLPPGRNSVTKLLHAAGYVDLIIPRGGKELIEYVRRNSLVSVIETGAGICHTYFDKSGDAEKGRLIIHNAKTRRVSVCNALDCLIIHRERLEDLHRLVGLCEASGVVIYADKRSFRALQGKYDDELLRHSDTSTYGTEFLSYKMAVKTVDSIEEALEHIDKYGSGHSEAIIAEDKESNSAFVSGVDAAAVYTNVSTAFTDGAQFGLGAEIGISTQKLHARGPMALEALTTCKWIIEGNGQIRS